MKPTRRALLVAFTWMISPLHAIAQVSPETVGKLRTLKARAEESAALMKDYYGDSSTEHITTRKLYMVARSEVEGVLGFMKQAVLNGSAQSAQTNNHLKMATETAVASATQFFNYVDSNTPNPASKPGPGAVVAIAEAVKIVIDILRASGAAVGVRTAIDEARRKAATDLERDLTWKSWSDLKKK